MCCYLFTLSIGLCSCCSFCRPLIPISVVVVARIIHSSAISEPQRRCVCSRTRRSRALNFKTTRRDGRLDDDGFHESLPSEAAHHSTHHHLGMRRRFSQICFLPSISRTSNEIMC